MRINNFPPEVIRILLSHVPRESLAPASLVCKTWRSAALHILYRCVRLISITDNQHLDGLLDVSRFENHPEDLISRIIRETNDEGKGLQVSSCVRRLRVTWNMDEAQLPDFGSAVSKMKNLEHLGWIVSVVHEIGWYDTLVQLHQELPNLRSLSLTMAQNEIPLDDSGEVISMVNLKELAIEFDEQIDQEPELEMPTSIVNLICGARNIESLSLDLQVDDSLEEYPPPFNWGPNTVFSAITSRRFPHLRKLCIGSYYRPTSLECLKGPGSGLQLLLRNQQQLQKVILYMHARTSEAELTITPLEMEETVPSIRHFGGPVLIVEALLKSRLASQVEVLEIIQLENIQRSNLPDLLQELDNQTVGQLPNLKGLSISTNGDGTHNNTDNALSLLAKLASRTPALEELVISAMQHPTVENKARELARDTRSASAPSNSFPRAVASAA
ncbi:unnamed protein product [Rhizoctonia solani]|uniref:F-box domain-containing protein n=1 Tax=Rhizoctonia solani TaxID=456999 RepID=A0A8H3DRF0_9AGAM|nr:unnamed protein product [Rhizoctonia solani]